MCHQIEAAAKLTSPAAGQLSGQVVDIRHWVSIGTPIGPISGLVFNHVAAQLLRSQKNHVAELMVGRIKQFGVAAFPRRLRNAVMGDQSVLDWAGTWEIHPDPLRSYLASFNLWAPLQVTLAWPGRATYETEVVEQFPIPAVIRDVLRGRYAKAMYLNRDRIVGNGRVMIVDYSAGQAPGVRVYPGHRSRRGMVGARRDQGGL
jgi:hypothetical protein